MKSPITECLAHGEINKTGISEPQMIDVVQFFFAITEKYEVFEQQIHSIIDNIDTCSAEKIADECTMIRKQKNQLAAMDDQLFAIIELAGNEIFQNPMVDEYRVAFAKANIACNTLHQKLLDVRTSLQKVSTPASSR